MSVAMSRSFEVGMLFGWVHLGTGFLRADGNDGLIVRGNMNVCMELKVKVNMSVPSAKLLSATVLNV